MENTTHWPELTTQLEYYLGDANLCRDQFFYTMIQETDDGFIPIEVFHKCNNIKKLNPSDSQIVEAVRHSKELELNDSLSAIRRLGNKELPEF